LFDKQLVIVQGMVKQNLRHCLGLIPPSNVSNFGEFNQGRCRVVGRVLATEHGMCCDAAELSVVRIDKLPGVR
jgi:hypothetical protein